MLDEKNKTPVLPELPPDSDQMSDYIDRHEDGELQLTASVELLPNFASLSPEDRSALNRERRNRSRSAAEEITKLLAHKEAIRESLVDPVTSLRNRKAYKQEAPAIFSRVKAGELACIYFDLNGLKRVNDTLGHKAGDSYLRAVADSLKRSLRPTDLIYRVGGDELLALLNGPMDSASEKLIIDRLKNESAEAVAGLNLPEEMYPGLSAGMSIKAEDDDLATFIERADANCEEDKKEFYRNLKSITGQDLRR